MTRVDSKNVIVDLEAEKSVEEIIEKARFAFNCGKTQSAKFRKQQLKNLVRFFDECEEEIVKALYEDLRKCRQEVFMGEINVILHDLRHTLFDFEKWLKPVRPDKALHNILDGVYVYNDPYGVVLIIGAWNYPFMLLLQPLIGAIAGGNCAILKPSELAPSSAKLITDRLPQYLDKDCYRIVNGSIEESTELLKHKFDYIFFTGSTNVGKIVHQAAAKFLTPTTLELGGKSPIYLDDSVNILTATKRILWGKCLNSGQTCISPDYLLCSKEVEEKFLQAAKLVLSDFYGGDFRQMSRIVSEGHFKRLVNFIEKSQVAIGGTYDPSHLTINPTILVNVESEDEVMKEEIFGPILPIVTVHSPLEAINFINNREKPLALYVFSKRKEIRDLFLKKTSSGAVTINDTVMHIMADGVPFGGVGASGMGAYHGKVGFDTFTHKKTVLVKSMWAVAEMTMFARYPPYSNFKSDLLGLVMMKRRSIGLDWLKWVFVFLLGVAVTYFVQFLCQ